MAVAEGEQSSAREQSVCSPFLSLPPPGSLHFWVMHVKMSAEEGTKPFLVKKLAE